MIAGRTVALVIPALDEEEALPAVLRRVDRGLVDRIVVCDNGSRDGTAEAARREGATVVFEPRRGYGSACLAAIGAAAGAEVFLFMDGDGSDDPADARALLSTLIDRDLDLVVGSRVLGQAEPGALTPVQRFGNLLTTTLVRILFGVGYTDLGPHRAITREALARLEMADPDFGWTIEMQVKAAQQGMRIAEIPVRRGNRRAGKSKVSGDLKGSFLAGKRILGYVLAAKLRELA